MSDRYADGNDGYDGLGICPVCGDVETINGVVCWRCQEQEQIDNDANPPAGVDFNLYCQDCGWHPTLDGICINPDCSHPNKYTFV